MMDSALFVAVADAAVRGTIILLAALGATALMRGSSASSRHLVWLAALAALLLLPIARGFVPEWRVLPLPAAPIAADPAPAVPVSIERSSAAPVSAAETAAAPAVAAAPVPWWAAMDWIRAALLVWAAGVALFGLRLAYGVARIWWIERRATELTDEEWVRLTDGLARRLGLGRIVRLLREPAATVPMTWGVFRPVVLLPAESEQWEAERRRVVLAHELAHVRRWDAATQWIAHLALVVFWFNPLVWVAVRKLREEREHACDDAVLEIGTRAADYAGHLLDIVRKLGTASGPAAALAMARRSQFEGRMLAILDNAVRRNGVSRTAGLATAAAALVCLVPLAALRPAPAASAEQTASAAARQPSVMRQRPDTPPVNSGVSALAEDGPSEARRDAALDRAIDSAVDPRVDRALDAAPEVERRRVASSVIAQRGRGDSDAAAILREAIGRGDPGLYAEIIRAAEDIKSSYSRREVLTGLLEKRDLSAGNIAAIIAATRTMDSDLEKRIVLTSVMEHRVFRDRESLPPAMLQALATFTSPLEQRIVITGLWEARRWDTASLAAVLRLVGGIRSDIERRIILTGAAERQNVRGTARDAYLAAARAIEGEGERGTALTALLGRQASSTPARAEQPEGTENPGTAARQPARGGVSEWDSDMELDGTRDGKPCYVKIHARDVFFGTARWDIRRIGAGGRLHVERRYDGHTYVVRAVPGEGGRPVFTFTVDGQQRPFEGEGRAWMTEILREYTGR